MADHVLKAHGTKAEPHVSSKCGFISLKHSGASHTRDPKSQCFYVKVYSKDLLSVLSCTVWHRQESPDALGQRGARNRFVCPLSRSFSCSFHILSELESCSSQSFHSIVEYIYMTKRKVIDRYGFRWTTKLDRRHSPPAQCKPPEPTTTSYPLPWILPRSWHGHVQLI